MVIITNEANATRVFENYSTRRIAAFTTTKNAKGTTIADGDRTVEVKYARLDYLPDEDTINAIKNGDVKMKKAIKKMVAATKKTIQNPSMKTADLGLGVCQLITMLTADRKSKRGPVVMVFILDNDDKVRNKIMTEFLNTLFGEFGITPITSKDTIKVEKKKKKGKTKTKKVKLLKWLFEKRKKSVKRVVKFTTSHDGCRMNAKGVALKRKNQVFFEMELRQSGLSVMSAHDLTKDETKACVKGLLKVYTAENLKSANNKTGKRLKKKNEKAVDAYKSLRDILRIMSTGDMELALPKVKYGQKKKGKGKNKHPVGPYTNVKKFKKFFMKNVNRALLFLVYAHSVMCVAGVDIGSKEYNSNIKDACAGTFTDDFTKAYLAAVKEYVSPKDASK